MADVSSLSSVAVPATIRDMLSASLCPSKFFIAHSEYEGTHGQKMDQVWIVYGDMIGG